MTAPLDGSGTLDHSEPLFPSSVKELLVIVACWVALTVERERACTLYTSGFCPFFFFLREQSQEKFWFRWGTPSLLSSWYCEKECFCLWSHFACNSHKCFHYQALSGLVSVSTICIITTVMTMVLDYRSSIDSRKMCGLGFWRTFIQT